jgi:DNA modification methylase
METKNVSPPAVIEQQYALVPVGDIAPHPSNPRKGAIGAIDASIAANGFYGAVVVQKSTSLILAGRHRWERAQALGIATVPVLFVECDDQTALRILLADNRTSDLSGYSTQALAELLESVRVQDGGFEGTGYDQAAFDEILAQAGDAILAANGGATLVEEEPPPVDRAEELLAKWPVERGQIWEIGKHRLMCGDSTDQADVARLMQGERAGLMNTDPPYGVSYDNSERPNPGVAKPRVAKPRVAKDDLRGPDLEEFLAKAFAAAKIALHVNAGWYVWNAYVQCGLYVAAAAAAGIHLSREIVWVKPVLLLGRGQYHWKHECAFFGWLKDGKAPPDYGLGDGERTQTTIWELKSISQAERKEFGHSTPKPVELFAIPITKHLKRGELCYEPFAGSGPQFVAAEQLQRRCNGLEIEPKFVAVILERMQKLGLEPKLAG